MLLCSVVDSPEDLDVLQQDISDWTLTHHLTLNILKTKCQHDYVTQLFVSLCRCNDMPLVPDQVREHTLIGDNMKGE